MAYNVQKTITTTDATVTILYQIVVSSQNKTFKIVGQILGRKSDFSATYSCGIEATVRRGASGNLFLVGSSLIDNPQTDSAGSPAATVTVSSPNLNLNVQGVASETWIWDLHLEKIDV